MFLDESRWSDYIPRNHQQEIGDRVREQLFKLPVNLFIEWNEPIFIEDRWFIEASRYIEIPYFDEYFAKRS